MKKKLSAKEAWLVIAAAFNNAVDDRVVYGRRTQVLVPVGRAEILVDTTCGFCRAIYHLCSRGVISSEVRNRMDSQVWVWLEERSAYEGYGWVSGVIASYDGEGAAQRAVIASLIAEQTR